MSGYRTPFGLAAGARSLSAVFAALAQPEGIRFTFERKREGQALSEEQVAAHWLDWQLKGSADGARWFVGSDCRLCTEPVGSMQRKGMK